MRCSATRVALAVAILSAVARADDGKPTAAAGPYRSSTDGTCAIVRARSAQRTSCRRVAAHAGAIGPFERVELHEVFAADQPAMLALRLGGAWFVYPRFDGDWNVDPPPIRMAGEDDVVGMHGAFVGDQYSVRFVRFTDEIIEERPAMLMRLRYHVTRTRSSGQDPSTGVSLGADRITELHEDVLVRCWVEAGAPRCAGPASVDAGAPWPR